MNFREKLTGKSAFLAITAFIVLCGLCLLPFVPWGTITGSIRHLFSGLDDLARQLVQGLENLGTGAYLIVSLIVFLETIVVVGQFIPGSIILISVGFSCYLQMFDFSAMLLSVFLAHYLGENCNYFLGRSKGRSLFREESRFFKPRFLEMAEAHFKEGGAKILIAGQFLGFLRPFISLAAGATHYSSVRFPIIMVFAAFLWSIMPLAIGFVAGASWEQAVRYMESFSLLALVVIPTAFISGWVIRRIIRYSGEMRILLERVSALIQRTSRYQHLSDRHPKVFVFLEARLSLSRPWGLGATGGFIAAATFFILCLVVLQDAQSEGGWKDLDLATINLLAQLRNPVADKIFLVLSYLGSLPVVLPVATLAGLLCWQARQMKSLVVIGGGVLFALAGSEFLRFSNNPIRADIAGADLLRFTRDHASVAFALFGALYYWLWNHPGILRIRASLAFFVLLCVFLIGFARMYFGVHAPSDITAGFCLGSGLIILSSTIAGNTVWLEDVQRRADFPAMAVLAAQVCLAVGLASLRPVPPPRNPLFPQELSRISSLSELVPVLPRDAADVAGNLKLPTNVVVVGPPDCLVKHLEGLSWQQSLASDFFTRKIAAPIFPAFVDGYPATTTMERRTSETRLVLRLWRSDYNLQDQQVWVGSVLAEVRHPKWRNFYTFRVQPDMDAALDAFTSDTQSLKMSSIPEFRKRDLYTWKFPFFTHGGAVLIHCDGE